MCGEKCFPAAVSCRHHYQGIQSEESVLMAGQSGRAGISSILSLILSTTASLLLVLLLLLLLLLLYYIIELFDVVDDCAMLHLKDVACRHHYQGIQSRESVLRTTEYRQMAGRAGRAGIDTQGEAILLANNPQLGKQLLDLMQVTYSEPWWYCDGNM